MKLVTFETGGRQSFGLVAGEDIIDLAGRMSLPSVVALLAADRLGDAAKFVNEKPDHKLASVTLLPCVLNPPHLYCIGVNYADHLAEVQKAGVTRPAPTRPPLFMRYAESYVGHGQDLVLPGVSTNFDYEIELTVVIGKGGRYVERDAALSHIAGYTIFNDGSIRDWQFHTQLVGPGKNFFATGALGPWMVTADEVGDPGNLGLELKLNGQTLQHGNTRDMVFNIADIVSYVSAFMPLFPGDLIATGTPAGVGFSRKPPIFMKAGDVCELTIEKIGTLRNSVRAEPVRDHWAIEGRRN
jgi:2-keto-4-pentenoate hydratase/2-oxohepta-3-ene-1,7-dioic acid hydratase in catechol pathway